MKNKKLSGSFYTPKILADFLVQYLSDKLKGKSSISVLEPSAGDGIFVKTIFNHETFSKKIQKLVGVEKSKRELNKITKEVKAKAFISIHTDFLEFQRGNKQKFSLVLGNPPYIKNSLLKKQQADNCKAIHQKRLIASIHSPMLGQRES